MRLFSSERAKRVTGEIPHILHLPIIQRLLHHKARRPVGAVVLGVSAMMTGSLIATNAAWVTTLVPIHHIVVDTTGYFIHAVGAVPILRYIEPFWMLIVGESK